MTNNNYIEKGLVRDQKHIFKTLRALNQICDKMEINNPIAPELVELNNDLRKYVYDNHYSEWVQEGRMIDDPVKNQINPLYIHAE